MQHRFGILPQIMPIFISQTLYYFESNVRGAVIIEAMGAGGFGRLKNHGGPGRTQSCDQGNISPLLLLN
jgi:ABC-type phosphate/phosphonate transport system permease subunit